MQPSALGFLATLAVLSPIPGAAGQLSGLSWTSGAKANISALEQARGRRIDIEHTHVGADPGMARMVDSTRTWVVRHIKARPAGEAALLSFWLLPKDHPHDWAFCTTAGYKDAWRQMGLALAPLVPQHPLFVEPGWEANLPTSHPWGVPDASKLPGYKTCFRTAVAALRSAAPGIKIVWTNSKIYRTAYSPDQMSPGDDQFDAYGLMYYDGYLPTRSQATWDKYVNSHNGTGGSPSGIGSWLAYAKAHGKRLGVSEYGPWDTSSVTTDQADDEVYIQNMHDFFKANAGSIAYETLQNSNTSTTDGHQLFPVANLPRASARYASQWKQG